MDFDVIVIGAGPAGLCVSSALAARGFKVGIIERLPLAAIAEPAFDGREIALTHRSVRILRDAGIWEHIPAAQISELRRAAVLNGSSPYRLRFEPTPGGEAVLGHLVANHLIRHAAYRRATESPAVTILSDRTVLSLHADARDAVVRAADGEAWRCRLVIAADSRHSQARRAAGIAADMVDFGKTMLVCRMRHQLPHDHTALEWFQDAFTIALLPLNADESSVVITETSGEAARLQSLDEAAFERDVRRRLGDRLGAMNLTSTRHLYPLVATYSRRFIGPRLALVGDAAVGMHPVTAHGFNLALQSQEVLLQELTRDGSRALDERVDARLRRYEARHRRASLPLYLATNAIVRLYTDRRPIAGICRQAALRLGNHLRPLNASIVGLLSESGAGRR